MIIRVNPQDRPPQHGGRLVQMFGDRNVPWDGPCGHLVNQRPEDDNGAHFHEADQYQLFIAGEGQVGGHAVATGSVHYADGYSGYGPITTGPQGCSYLTLRPSFDNTRHLLPAEAALAKGRKGRQHNARMNLDAACVPGVIALFERPDGVGAYQVEVAPGAAPASVMLRGGSYWVVMRGEAEIDGQASPPSTCVWVGEGEAPPAIIAGPDGVTIAVLGFADRRSQTARGARTGQGAEVH